MESIKALRERCGLSQRALARRAGLSFRGLQLIESTDHDPRLSSLEKVARAVRLPDGAMCRVVAALFAEPPDSVFCASLRVLSGGRRSWKVPLFDFVDAFRREPSPGLVCTPPAAEMGARLVALFAATAETLTREHGLSPPAWVRGAAPLAEPWFVSGYESLKASALVESPVPFRSRNLFVLGNFLVRR